MRQVLVISVVMNVALAAGCQAPSEPNAIKTGTDSAYTNANHTGTASTQTNGNVVTSTNPAAGAALTSCGSQVGTDTMKKDVAACLAKGMFYDRQYADPNTKLVVGQCTTMPVAQIPCAVNDVKSVMSDGDSKTLDGYFADANSLQGFIVDQILDCSSSAASGFAGCKLDGVPAGVKVIRLYMAKQASSQIMIKTLVVALPAK